MTKSSLKHHCNCRFFSIFRLEIAARWQLFYVVDMSLQYERIWDLSGGKGWSLKKCSLDINTGKLLTVFQKKRAERKNDKDVELEEVDANALMKKDDGMDNEADGKGNKRKKDDDKGKKADDNGKGKKDDGKGKKADGKGKKADGKKANAKKAVKKDNGKKAAMKAMKKDDGKGKKAVKKGKKAAMKTMKKN